jgi:hypothetical protein
VPGFPYPIQQIKFDCIVVPAKNAASTPALSNPDMGPQSRPSARTHNDVGTLQAAIAQCVHFSQAWLLKKLSHHLSSLRI